MKTLNKKFFKNNKLGFTLVELIIVITILAILATIAFISFQGYSKNARDGNRLTALRGIKNGLEIYYTQVGNYPDTESGTLIQSSGGLTTIGTQGYFGDTNSRLLKFSKTPTDPYDVSKYIYSVNTAKNKYQILGFLETSDYVSLLNNTYAAIDYSARTPKTLGDNLGILLDTNNNPINGTGIDVENYTGSLKAVFGDNYNISGTGTTIKILKASYVQGKLGWWYYDNNCDLPDVVIGNQTWAGCNSTLGYGAEWGQRFTEIGTDNFNGSVGGGGSYWNYNGTSLSTSLYGPIGSKRMLSSVKENSWSGATGVQGVVNNIWGKFYVWDDLSQNCKGGDLTGTLNNSKCPCPTGWHIPTSSELEKLEDNLYGGNCSEISSNWFCSGIGWKDNYIKEANNNLVKALNIPLSGAIGLNSGIYQSNSRGYAATLWSSTSSGSTAYATRIRWYQNTISRNEYFDKSTFGYNIRCVRD